MSFLQVASWNIEHLSGASREDKKQSAFALADHIEMSGIDLIALQEVYVTDWDEEVRLMENQPPIPNRSTGNERRNADLDRVCYLLEEHLEVEWNYLVLPNRQAGDKSQLCAIMWNTGRMSLREVHKLSVDHDIDGYTLWDRAPHAVTFTSPLSVWRKDDASNWIEVAENKTFTVVPLHMKSNYGGGTLNMLKRELEAKTLVSALEKAKEDGKLDPTLILIGDTNVLKFDEPAIIALVSAGYIDLNNTDSPTYWSRAYGDSPFDRAFIAPNRPEFRYTRQYVLRSADLVLHDQFLSDHYMIKMSIKLYLDDNDARGGVHQ
jgi:hypothetical protein